MITRRHATRKVALLIAAATISSLCAAVTTNYEYDALGRLVKVTHANGNVVTYTLDAAGNRSNVEELSGQSRPGSIAVPLTSLTGTYTVTWTAGGTVTSYELWESTSSTFTTQTRVFVGAGTNASISGHGNGTFYYRVRGCNGSACTQYLAGGNGTVVTVPPGAPASLTVPGPSTTGSYTIGWGAASGTKTGFELYESTTSGFSSETLVYSGTGSSKLLSGRANGTWYYRVRACNGLACSGYAPGPNSVVVTLPPAAPSAPSLPGTSNTGSYGITWGTVSGPVTAYELYEATNSAFTGATRVYNAATASTTLSGRANGTYYYRVRACNGSACGGYSAASSVIVTLPPGAPASLGVPGPSTTGSFTITWGLASGTMTAYQLYESTNSGFSSETLVYSGTGSSKLLSGRANGTWYYRVRACNGTACSGYAPGPNSVVVTLPPGAPSAPTVAGTSNTGSYPISWGTATGTVTAYELYEATNSAFTGAVRVYNAVTASTTLSGRANGTYYYRVRACNGSACGSYSASSSVVVTLPPGAPASLGVPGPSTTGSFTISWGLASGTTTAYQLYESTNSGFSGESLVYSGTGSSTLLSGRGNGTWYYRVRACNVSACSGYAPGANSIVVTLPPGAPSAPSGPGTSTSGSYGITWGAASGTVTRYELYEATNSSFSGEALIYNSSSTSTSVSGRGNGTYYYRARACNGGACGGYSGTGSVFVTLPPGAPASLNVPGSSTSGSFTVGWGAASGTMTAYQLYESTNSGFSGESLVYSGTGSSIALSGRGNGTWYYRVLACNGSACSGYAPGSNSIVVTLPPGAPSTPAGPGTSNTGSYGITWGAASGNVSTYELYEATNSGFSGEALIYNSTGTSTSVSGRGNGTWYYRARACNNGVCGGYSGTGSVVVTLPPGAPAVLNVPATNNTGNYLVSWSDASGTVSEYQLYEATNSSFSGEALVYNLAGTSTTLLGRINGTYYLRVRACYNGQCSGFTGSNSVTVSLAAPQQPGDPRTYTQSSQCTWRAYWPPSANATSYTVRDVSGNIQVPFNVTPGANPQTGEYNFCGVSGYSGIPNDYRPKWVRACNANGCSPTVNFPVNP